MRVSKIRSRLFATVMVPALAAGSAPAQAVPADSTSLSLIRDAAQSMAAGNLQLAENELQAVLRTHPAEYRALNLLGIVRAQQHRDAEAEQLFRQAIQHKPDFVSAYVDLGLLYAQSNRGDDAIPQFQEALRLDPARADARDALVAVWRDQARAAVTAKDPEKALALLIEARKVAPQSPDVLYEFGMVALHMSLFTDAVSAFQETLARRKDDSHAIYALGRAQIGQAKFQDAEQSFERYLQLDPNDASGHYALGFVLQSLQKSDQARREFARSIELQPVQTESYFQLGLIDLDENNLSSAADRFTRVLGRDPKHAGALTGMGRVAFQQKDYKQASDFLQRASAADPSLRQAHYYLGMTYGRLGRKEDSERELQLATQLERAEVEQHQAGVRLLGPEDSVAGEAQDAK